MIITIDWKRRACSNLLPNLWRNRLDMRFSQRVIPEEDSENVGKDENSADISTEATDWFGLFDHIVLEEVSDCGTEYKD